MDSLPVRKKIGNILGIAIPPMGYRQVFAQLNQLGKIGDKQMIEILVVLCEEFERREPPKEQPKLNG